MLNFATHTQQLITFNFTFQKKDCSINWCKIQLTFFFAVCCLQNSSIQYKSVFNSVIEQKPCILASHKWICSGFLGPRKWGFQSVVLLERNKCSVKFCTVGVPGVISMFWHLVYVRGSQVSYGSAGASYWAKIIGVKNMIWYPAEEIAH